MKRQSGVYVITNLINKKIYIGSSIDIKVRWSNHKSELKRGVHNNKYLQNAWNKYGEENFKFEILEICNIEGLNNQEAINKVQDLEQKYLEELQPYGKNGYNLNKYAHGGKEGITWSNIKNGELVYPIEVYKKVIKMLQNPKYSYRKIEKETGMSKTNIISIYNKTKYKELTKNIIFPKRQNKCYFNCGNSGISIYKYDIYKNFVKKYSSMTQACKDAKCNFPQIQRCCRNEIPSAGGFYWSYTDKPREFTKIEQILGHYIVQSDGKPVIEYINDIPVNIYESISQIQKFSISILRHILELKKPKIISQDYKYFIKYAKDADEKDLDYLISNKNSK